MIDEKDPFIYLIAAIFALIIMILIEVVIINSSRQNAIIRSDREECQNKGGVYLDRTYYDNGAVSNRHIYTCVKKEMIIE